MKKSIYEDRKGTSEEVEFQKAFKYLFDVSMKVIGDGDSVWEKSILDVGAGGNPELGLELGRRSAMYTAFDINPEFLELLHQKQLSTVRGDILLLPSKPQSFDIVHTRNILMHMSEEDLPIAINNILSLARERAIFLELNWTSFKAGGDVTKKFQEFSIELISEHGDPFVADKLLRKVSHAAGSINHIESIEFDKFKRKADAYYYEIIPLVKMMIRIMEQKKHRLLECGKELLGMITEESKKDYPEKFVPPDVMYVEAVYN